MITFNLDSDDSTMKLNDSYDEEKGVPRYGMHSEQGMVKALRTEQGNGVFRVCD